MQKFLLLSIVLLFFIGLQSKSVQAQIKVQNQIQTQPQSQVQEQGQSQVQARKPALQVPLRDREFAWKVNEAKWELALLKDFGCTKEVLTLFLTYYKDSIVHDRMAFFFKLNQHEITPSDAPLYFNQLQLKYHLLFQDFNRELTTQADKIATELQARKQNPYPLAIDCSNANPACDNINFSNGTLDAWTSYYGLNLSTTTSTVIGNIFNSPQGTITGPVSEAGLDPYTGYATYQVSIMSKAMQNQFDYIDTVLPIIPPGSNYSVRIGDSVAYGYNLYGLGGFARLVQQFKVDPSNPILTIQYAVILQYTATHTKPEEPYFKIAVTDSIGDTIPNCGSYYQYAVPGLSDYHLYPIPGDSIDSVYCKSWTTLYVSLQKYAGHCVTLSLEAADCGPAGHLGYAYVVPSCGGLTINPVAPSFCPSDRAITLTASASPYYQWTAPSSNCIAGSSTSQNVSVNCAGVYTLTVGDGGSCTATTTTLVKSGLPTSASSETSINCYNGNDGSVQVNVSKGAPSYTYSWNRPNGDTTIVSASSSSELMHLSAGNYVVTITDASGCSATDTVQVTQPNEIEIVTIETVPPYCGMSNGVISAAVTGGTRNYGYSWNTSATDSVIKQIAAGQTYSVTVTDANGCSATALLLATRAPSPTVAIKSSKPIVCSGKSDTLRAVPLSGIAPYTYLWNPSSNASDSIQYISPANPTAYTVTITDATNCTSTTTVLVQVGKTPKARIAKLNDTTGCAPLCINYSAVSLSGSNLPTNYGISYNFGDSTSVSSSGNHCYLKNGIFTATVTIDSAGCDTVIAAGNRIYANTVPILNAFSVAPNPVAVNDTVHFQDVSQGALLHLFKFGDNTKMFGDTSHLINPIYIYRDTGTYKVWLIEQNGSCKDSISEDISVFIPCNWPSKIPNVFTPNGDHKNDVFQIEATGLESLTCSIYDRWGLEIYTINGVTGSWDGKDKSGATVASATYYYLINATCILQHAKRKAQGFVELMR